ncbi:TrmH family RNA methyltransferase [Thermoflexus sp.]|uniref:TrmH family RNA methyltransferase n=1 Tax=Thermoflexus sp. TaxID=1969742 RepID=UPI0035E43DBB
MERSVRVGEFYIRSETRRQRLRALAGLPRLPYAVAAFSLGKGDKTVGLICRSAVAWGAERLLVIGSPLWDRTTACATDEFIQIEHFPSVADFLAWMDSEACPYEPVIAEKTASSIPLQAFTFPRQMLLILGHPSFGVPDSLLWRAPQVHIETALPVPSLNVAVAAGILLYHYWRQVWGGESWPQGKGGVSVSVSSP